MQKKKGFVFVFLIIAALVVGSLLTYICQDSQSFSWLAYTKSIGIGGGTPLVLDLIAIKLTLGFTLEISIAHVVCLILVIILYPKITKSIE